MQTEFCPIQLQLNQIYNDCEGALAWAESHEEELEIIAIVDRQIKELLNQESQPMYEVIKNNRRTGILIEATSEMAASIKYAQMPQDHRQYNLPCIKISFKKVAN